MAAGRHGGYKDRELRETDVTISRRKDHYQDRVRRQDGRDSGFVRLQDDKERSALNGGPDLRGRIGNYSKTERESGEMSRGSGLDYGETSRREKVENGSRGVENGNSAVPSKKRKFSPIIWDRDDGKQSGTSPSRSKADQIEKVAPVPLPPLPPPPPPASSNAVEPMLDKVSASDEVSAPSGLEQQQGDIDQNARRMVEDTESIAVQRGVSFSRWADTETVISNENNERLEHKVPSRRITTPLNNPSDNHMQRSAATPEVVDSCLREGSGRAITKPFDSELEQGGHSDEFKVDKLDLMDVDTDKSNDEASSGRHAETDSEAEDTRSETPERMQTPHRCINMLQGCRSVDEFERLNKIDEGTYGVVYRAKDKKFGEIVALKKVKMEKEREGFPLTSLREINILLSLHHPSIVDVKEVVVGRTLDSIFMVMEYMEHDLKGLMEAMKQPFSQSEVKCLMLQLFSGIKYLHDNWVLHRDLKTSNILLNNRGELKICDFGLSRQYGSPLKPYTHLVVTLWYRAPELLLGAKEYSTAIDMWSLGCIMAELLGKEPLFSGKTEFDQLDKIFRILGTPNEKIWPGFAKLPGVKVNFVKQPYNKLREKFPATSFSGRPTLSEAGFDLLNKLLTYDPEKRISAEAALRHDWFHEVPLPKSKEFMPTFPAQHAQDRRLRRVMKSPDPLAEQRKKELQQGELGFSSLFG